MIEMEDNNIFDEFSRNLARELFPNTYRGRTLSQMAADGLGMNTQTVHVIGLGILGAVLINSRKK